MSEHLERREFLRQAILAGTATMSAGALVRTRPALAAKSPNEKLNLGCIGVANKGKHNIDNLTGENIVALCDVDSLHLEGTAAQFPKAAKYADFRQMLDKEKNLDAVVVSTPDHTHAIPVVWALRRGLDVYCEKPLAHSVSECRQMRYPQRADPRLTPPCNPPARRCPDVGPTGGNCKNARLTDRATRSRMSRTNAASLIANAPDFSERTTACIRRDGAIA